MYVFVACFDLCGYVVSYVGNDWDGFMMKTNPHWRFKCCSKLTWHQRRCSVRQNMAQRCNMCNIVYVLILVMLCVTLCIFLFFADMYTYTTLECLLLWCLVILFGCLSSPCSLQWGTEIQATQSMRRHQGHRFDSAEEGRWDTSGWIQTGWLIVDSC